MDRLRYTGEGVNLTNGAVPPCSPSLRDKRLSWFLQLGKALPRSAPGPAQTALSAIVLPAGMARSRGARGKNPRWDTRRSGFPARTPAGPAPDPAGPGAPAPPVPPPRGCGAAAPWASPRQALPARCPSVTSCRRLRPGAVPAPRRPRGAQQPKAPARAAPPRCHCPAAAMTGRGGGAAGGGRDPAGPSPLGSAPLPLQRPPAAPRRACWDSRGWLGGAAAASSRGGPRPRRWPRERCSPGRPGPGGMRRGRPPPGSPGWGCCSLGRLPTGAPECLRCDERDRENVSREQRPAALTAASLK